jgi:hypothetical protein
MDTCTDPALGALLHAYELGILASADESRFEIHLLSCDACRKAAEEFETEAAVLRGSDSVKQVVSLNSDGATEPGPSRSSIWGCLWPDTPWLLRPGLLYVAVLLLLFPAFVGLEHLTAPGSSTRLTQVIRLVRSRGAMDNTFSISSGLDGVVSFEIPNAIPGKDYQVIIVADDGTRLGRWEGIRSLDDLGVVNLVLPNNRMSPGKCRLTVIDPLTGQTPPVAEYRFEIEQ